MESLAGDAGVEGVANGRTAGGSSATDKHIGVGHVESSPAEVVFADSKPFSKASKYSRLALLSSKALGSSSLEAAPSEGPSRAPGDAGPGRRRCQGGVAAGGVTNIPLGACAARFRCGGWGVVGVFATSLRTGACCTLGSVGVDALGVPTVGLVSESPADK